MSNANRPNFLGFLFRGPKPEVAEVAEVEEVEEVEEGEMNEAVVEYEPAPNLESLHNDLNFGLNSAHAETQAEPNSETQPAPNRPKRNLLSIIFSTRRTLREKASAQDLTDLTMTASLTDSLSAPTVLDLEVEEESEKEEEETPVETMQDEEELENHENHENHEGGFFQWVAGLFNGGTDGEDEEYESAEQQQEVAEEETPEAPLSTLTEPLLPPETHDVENPGEEAPADTSEHPKSSKLCICLNITLCLLMLVVVILVGYYTWTGHCADIKSCLSNDSKQFSSDVKHVSSNVASGAQTGWGYVESGSVTTYEFVSSGVVTGSKAVASGVVTASRAVASATVHCYDVVSGTVKGWFS